MVLVGGFVVGGCSGSTRAETSVGSAQFCKYQNDLIAASSQAGVALAGAGGNLTALQRRAVHDAQAAAASAPNSQVAGEMNDVARALQKSWAVAGPVIMRVKGDPRTDALCP